MHDFQNDLPISKWKPKKMKNILANLHDKKEDKKQKTSIKPWISIEKNQKVIKINQEISLKRYINMNIELRKM